MKYKITNNVKEVLNPYTDVPIKVYQIEYTKDIEKYNIKTGDLGGWLENKHNLSQDGDCVVTGETIVTGDAYIYDNALVYNTRVHGRSFSLNKETQHLEISGNAKVISSFVVGTSKIFDVSIVTNSIIKDNTRIYGNAVLIYASIQDIGHVFNNAIINNINIDGSKRIHNFYYPSETELNKLFHNI